MIWSVSTSGRSSTAARAVTARNAFMRPTASSRGRRRSGRRSPRRPPSPGSPGASGRPCPGVPRSCGWRSRRSARPGARMSGFMPRHIEQPAPRHSKPASSKIRSSPSSSACRFTAADPGTTIARTLSADTPVRATTAAAARRSSIRAFVHEPMNTRSTWMSCSCVPGSRPMYARARSAASRSSGSSSAEGSGTRSADRRDHRRGSSPTSPAARARRRRSRPRDRSPRRRRCEACASGRAPLPAPHPWGRRAGLPGTRTSCRRERSSRRGRRPRSTCCRWSAGLPSRAAGSPSPAYSMTWPTAPSTPIRPIDAEDDVLGASRRAAARPSKRIAIVFGLSCGSSGSPGRARPRDVPMPNASAPNAPWVDVWLSPQTIVMPGCVSPSSGPMTCTIPSRPLPRP